MKGFLFLVTGWCAVKPEVFHEIYGSHCQALECGDICLNISPARSPNQQQQQQHTHYQLHHHQSFSTSSHLQHGGSLIQNIKIELGEEKSVPISILPHHNHHSQQQHPSPINMSPNNNANQSTSRQSVNIINGNPLPHMSRKAFPVSSSNKTKKLKDGVTKIKKQSVGNGGENKGRRPMNGFLLFAKDKRPELIQMYPGKDNR
jgi:hypothetical protein